MAANILLGLKLGDIFHLLERVVMDSVFALFWDLFDRQSLDLKARKKSTFPFTKSLGHR
jgi:hypothetical protein